MSSLDPEFLDNVITRVAMHLNRAGYCMRQRDQLCAAARPDDRYHSGVELSYNVVCYIVNVRDSALYGSRSENECTWRIFLN